MINFHLWGRLSKFNKLFAPTIVSLNTSLTIILNQRFVNSINQTLKVYKSFFIVLEKYMNFQLKCKTISWTYNIIIFIYYFHFFSIWISICFINFLGYKENTSFRRFILTCIRPFLNAYLRGSISENTSLFLS